MIPKDTDLDTLSAIAEEYEKKLDKFDEKLKSAKNLREREDLKSKRDVYSSKLADIKDIAKAMHHTEKEAKAIKNFEKDSSDIISKVDSAKLSSKKSIISNLSSYKTIVSERKMDIEEEKSLTSKVVGAMGKIYTSTQKKLKEVKDEERAMWKLLEDCDKGIKSAREKLLASKSSTEMDEIKSTITKTTADSKKVERKIEELKSMKEELESKLDTGILDSKNYYLKKRHDKSVDSAVNVISVNNLRAQEVDLCFILDGTGSMDPWIDLTKEKIKEIINEITKVYIRAKIRIGIVVYRDFDQKDRSFEIYDFRDGAEFAKKFLDGVKTIGGDDGPEDINGGFQRVLQLDWKSISKILIHFADAPAHGARFNLGGDSNNSVIMSSKLDQSWEEIFRELKTIGIDYHFMEIKGTATKRMTDEFTKIWTTCGHLVYQDLKPVVFRVHSINTNSAETVMKITDSVKESIRRSIAYLTSGKTPFMLKKGSSSKVTDVILEESEEEYKPLDWSSPLLKWNLIQGSLISVAVKRIEVILQSGFKILQGETKILLQPYPFSAGTFNQAYGAKLEQTKHLLVAKLPKDGTIIDEDQMKLELKKKGIAISLARTFNSKLKALKHFPWARIFFIQSYMFRAHDGKIFILEGFINGSFKKYTNNLDAISTETEVRHMTAFAHFSYQMTKGKYLVTDFQGVNNFLLTDPCLHSESGEFADSGDQKHVGFVNFFAKHQCNEICKALKLEMPKNLQLDHPEIKKLTKWTEKVFTHSASDLRMKCWAGLCNNELKPGLKPGEKNHCSFCKNLMDREEEARCVKCSTPYSFKPNYFLLAGLNAPKKCEGCRKKKKRDLEKLFDDEESTEELSSS